MLTIHILTKNNSQTIKNTFDSINHIKANVIIGDLGSTDNTINICQSHGVTIYHLGNMRRDKARNRLIELADEGMHFYIEPWESVIQGHNSIAGVKRGCGCVSILQGHSLTQEIRIWDGSASFINPVFERLDTDNSVQISLTISSRGGIEAEETLKQIDQWKLDNPISSIPYYYQACILFSHKKYEDFLRTAEHYLFMDKTDSMATTMIHYYYAIAQLLHKKSYKPALQNLTLCLCSKPLMAEFWCLTGDVFYHLLHRFNLAKEFYENAIILGEKRLKADKWPMDISKYRAYPKKMIESCEAIINNKDLYAQMPR